jgi:hypothetical protein
MGQRPRHGHWQKSRRLALDLELRGAASRITTSTEHAQLAVRASVDDGNDVVGSEIFGTAAVLTAWVDGDNGSRSCTFAGAVVGGVVCALAGRAVAAVCSVAAAEAAFDHNQPSSSTGAGWFSTESSAIIRLTLPSTLSARFALSMRHPLRLCLAIAAEACARSSSSSGRVRRSSMIAW